MATIPLRDLRNKASEVVRRAEAGEDLTITIDGRPVARLTALPRRQAWVPRAEVLAALRDTPVDAAAFMADVRPADRERVGDSDPW